MVRYHVMFADIRAKFVCTDFCPILASSLDFSKRCPNAMHIGESSV